MNKTIFNISKMDCASEEQLIRMQLGKFSDVKSLQFDLPNRKLQVFHTDDHQDIFAALDRLNLNTKFISTGPAEEYHIDNTHNQRKLLWQVLLINLFFFVAEIVAGFIANSMGLVADSLDMLADALVYGLALFAVGGTIVRKNNIARLSGYFQLSLAAFGFIEVIRRFLGVGEVPNYQTMMIVSLLALTGNAFSLYLLQKQKSKEAHMQASTIFTSNDVIVNLGVIVAGGLVYLTASNLPDLIVGIIIFLVVAQGAFRILQISRRK